jgi:steroid 5-alpha reductase family enzyme
MNDPPEEGSQRPRKIAMTDWQSQAHVKWDCKYHVVIVPEYRQRVFFVKRRKQIGEIRRDLSLVSRYSWAAPHWQTSTGPYDMLARNLKERAKEWNAMGLVELLLVNLGVVAGMMLCVWLVSLLLRDVSIVDLVWGAGFALIAWVTFFATGTPTLPNLLIACLTSVWGLRLSGYLAWRNLGQPEDYRYRAMREAQGSQFAVRSLLTVFGLQGLVMWIVALPIQAGQLAANQTGIGGITLLGIAIWIVGFVFESVGDSQLARFKALPENQGKVMDRGLWRYTRHPNYFGDFLVWWGLYLVSFGRGAAWWSAIGPVVMSVFLMRVSGVTLLERSLKARKPGYEDYVRRTSAFFPLPPKRNANRQN